MVIWGLGFGVRGSGVWGLGFGVWGFGFRVWDIVWGVGFGVWGLRFGVSGLGFRISGLGPGDLEQVEEGCSTRRPREIGNLLPNNQRQRRTCYALCHIIYPVSAAHTSIFRMPHTGHTGGAHTNRNQWQARAEGLEQRGFRQGRNKDGRRVKLNFTLRPCSAECEVQLHPPSLFR